MVPIAVFLLAFSFFGTARAGAAQAVDKNLRNPYAPIEVDGVDAGPSYTLAYSYPSSMDWRNKDGRNWVTPVKNQGNCGACWAFGAVGVVESRAMIALGDPDHPIDLSEQDLVSCSGIGDCGGAALGSMDSVFAYTQSTGIVDESCFPYAASNLPCSNKCGDWQAKTVRVLDYEKLPASTEPIKQAISDYGPVTVYMAVLSDFLGYQGGVYSHSDEAELKGFHAVSIVGYDDAGQYWICKNSWGSGWGESGFFRISYSENVLNYTAWQRDLYDWRTFFLDGSYVVRNTDIDNDGFADQTDACPYARGIAAYGGCPDVYAPSVEYISPTYENGTTVNAMNATIAVNVSDATNITWCALD
ncbi:MAG: C1 family peptidase, partial [Candidatus Aenigmatarchaeota archaeon]